MIRSFCVKPQSIAWTGNTTFWRALHRQTERLIFEPARTHHLGLKVQYFENPIFIFGCFSLKAVYDSCKLQSFCLCTLLLTLTVFLFRNLTTEIVIFINICYKMKCFSGDSFSFPGTCFANIPPTFLISFEVQTRYSKALRYSQQYIRDHLSGTKVKIWICSGYDAVFNFFCIASCNQTNSLTFYFI